MQKSSAKGDKKKKASSSDAKDAVDKDTSKDVALTSLPPGVVYPKDLVGATGTGEKAPREYTPRTGVGEVTTFDLRKITQDLNT